MRRRAFSLGFIAIDFYFSANNGKCFTLRQFRCRIFALRVAMVSRNHRANFFMSTTAVCPEQVMRIIRYSFIFSYKWPVDKIIKSTNCMDSSKCWLNPNTRIFIGLCSYTAAVSPLVSNGFPLCLDNGCLHILSKLWFNGFPFCLLYWSPKGTFRRHCIFLW